MSEPTPLFGPLAPERVPPRLWKDGRFVDDPWTVLADDAAPTGGARLIVPLARWRAELGGDAARVTTLGVSLVATDEFHASELLGAPVIAIAFAKFTDGRAYSSARRLREAGYRGEIRAIGDVLADQAPLMLRAGFNALVISDAAAIATLERSGVPAVRRIYQSSSAECGGLWQARR